MHTHLLDPIPFAPDPGELGQELRVRGDDLSAEFARFLAEAQEVARPKALYTVAALSNKTETSVTVEQTEFHSRVLRVNLDVANRVFPFIATCGAELEAWGQSQEDMLKSYWADGIQMAAVFTALQAVKNHIAQNYRPEGLSMMNPGSLADWPLSEQRALFGLLGDVKAAVGVELKPSLMMAPAKSASGLFFPLAESFESCQLCPMPDCPNRRAPYDADLFAQKYTPAPA